MRIHSPEKRPIQERRSCTGAALTILSFLICSSASAQPASAGDQIVEEIVVTGSYVARPSQATQSSPIQVIGADEIDRSGLVGVDDLLLLNTANVGSVGGVQDLLGGVADNRASRSANLRGLGPASTLVLLNGRRVASIEVDALQNNYVNLAMLVPMIEVERVETVLDGASALYGSDAIAGVMNVITHDSYDGFELSGQYTDIDDAPGYIVQAMLGGGGDRFHGVVSASYEFKDNLQNAERSATNFPNTSGLAQPGNYILSGRPQAPGGGDAIIDNGVNGPINYSQLYDQISAATGSSIVQFADPSCTVPGTGGIFAGSSFPDGSCRFSYQEKNPIQPQSKVALAHARATYALTDLHELFFETRYAHQQSVRSGIGSLPITTGRVVVPAESPFNPFGVDAQFAGRVLGVNAPFKDDEVTIDNIDITLGVRGDLNERWNYTVSGLWTRAEQKSVVPDTDLISLQNALNGFGGPDCRILPDGSPDPGETAGAGNCVYFSPFGADQLSNDPRTAFNVLTPATTGSEVEYLIAEAVLVGELFSLPGGPVGIALGAQVRDESTANSLDGGIVAGRFGFLPRGLPGSGSRTIHAGFVELYLPIVDTLEAQLAVRHEDYGPFSTTDPKIGLNWHPIHELSIRGSISTAFRGPSLAQATSTAVTAGVGQTIDPLDPTDAGTFRVINRVSNPDLEPEDSKNYNIGATWEPVDDLSLSVDYWRFDFEDQIALEAAQQVIDADPNGPQLIRDSLGQLLGVNVGFFNAGATTTDGFDVRFDYRFDVGAHMISLRNSATYIRSYEVQLGTGQPVVDVVGRRNSNNPGAPTPRWRNNFTAQWDHGPHSAGATVRYTSGVDEDLGVPLTGSPTAKISSWTAVDAQYAYRFGNSAQYEVTVGALNLFDEEPPAAAFTGYLPTLADALGRQAYLRLSMTVD